MENKTLRTAGLGLAAMLLASVGLTACSNDQPAEETSNTTAPATSAPANDTTDDAMGSAAATETGSTTEAASPTSASATIGSGDFDATFAAIVDAASEKLECLDDDQSDRDDADDLRISDSDKIISITGDCDDVVITGNNLVIAMAEVDDLQVLGNGNAVAVQDLDDVMVSGSENKIGWNPVHEDDPDLNDMGSNNVLRIDAVKAADLDL